VERTAYLRIGALVAAWAIESAKDEGDLFAAAAGGELHWLI